MSKTLFTTSIRHSMQTKGLLIRPGKGARVIVEISDALPRHVEVPEDCFLIVTIRKPHPSCDVRLRLVDGTDMSLSAASESTWLIPPKALLTQAGGRIESVTLYYIPQRSLSDFAMACGRDECSSLLAPHAANDPFLQLLARVATPMLSESEERRSGESVIRYFLSSLLSHLALSYGTSATVPKRLHVGGLAPRQKMLVQRLLVSAGNLLLSSDELAAKCGLSSTHFARAFRQTFGTTAHKYLMQLRLEQAKLHLAQGQLSLEEVGRRAGYSDQATFTETFKRFAGTTPGKFRRRYAQAATSSGSSLSLSLGGSCI